jgi:alanine-glyoxylate transaminase/serine-glyoxylate transaminase/serine-pyruvate transaminase
MNATPFHPPRRTLMGPGPSDVSPRVLAALARPTLGHLDPAFVGFMDTVKELLQYAFQTANALTFPISAPGSAGMEACLVNLVEPGDSVAVCVNGVFGGRMREIVSRCGGIPFPVESSWGDPVDPEALEECLDAHPEISVVAFVHAETSTGVLSDAARIAEVAHAHGCLVVADAVTSLGGVPLRVDEWGLDAVYSGSQKCLSCVPGLSPVTFGSRAVERIHGRRAPVQSWFLDTELVMGYWGSGQKRSYHHTAPVNALYALHESLVVLAEEGLEQSWLRHRRNHEALRDGLEAMGLELAVAQPHRLPQLNTVRIPEGVDDAEVRRRLLTDHGLEIGAGLGDLAGSVWRIGLMGHGSSMGNVIRCLTALEAVLTDMDAPIHRGRALRAATVA